MATENRLSGGPSVRLSQEARAGAALAMSASLERIPRATYRTARACSDIHLRTAVIGIAKLTAAPVPGKWVERATPKMQAPRAELESAAGESSADCTAPEPSTLSARSAAER